MVDALVEQRLVTVFRLDVVDVLRALDALRFLLQSHGARFVQVLDVRGQRGNRQLVYLMELFGVGHCRTGHACQLIVKAEVILQGDGRSGNRLPLDLHPFLGLNSFVEPLGVAASGHQPAG